MKAKGRGKTPATVMTPEEAFLQAIHANGTDPGPWQMYADWLEEGGDPTAVLYREWQSTNSLGMQFVTVPQGSFWMGGGGGRTGIERRRVAAFQIGICAVTQSQWEAVMGNNPSWFSRTGRGNYRVATVADADLRSFPVENVSWYDVRAFLGKLNGRERERGWCYRLPSEIEWEYACRGAPVLEHECSLHFYAGTVSDALSSNRANFNGNYPYGWAWKGPFLGRTTRVGSYPGNRLGIFDLHGNVWEWCEDRFEEGSCRVVRGGSWYDFGGHCRASFRDLRAPNSPNSRLGFRLARSSVR